MTALLLLIELAAAACIAFQAVARVTRMSRRTNFSMFAGWVLMGGAAAGSLAGLLTQQTAPDINSTTLLVAVALVATLDRRRSP